MTMTDRQHGPRIRAKNTIVELDGDEMTRIIWQLVKRDLIEPFVELKLEYYDLGLPRRDATDDRITVEAAEAIRRHGVGVKCATITPNDDRVVEYKLKKAWASPNGTLRAILDGTVFRKPIMAKNVPPTVRSWMKPITIGRHAYGDMYKSAEMRIRKPGLAEIVFTPSDGSEPTRLPIHEFKVPGIVRGVHNLDNSIRSFARACIAYALSERIDMWFSGKDTIAKVYHGAFREIFRQETDARKADLDAAGIHYTYLLIDDAVARAVRNPGGFLWACMNYDGDVMSDMVASGFGSLGLMTSVLVSPDGKFEFEAAHGTVTKHYRQHQEGKPTSTNSTATIFAWTGAIAKRGELDGTPELVDFAHMLERSVIETIESGVMTKDLAAIADPRPLAHADTQEFIEAIARRLRTKLESVAATR
jgi:isocitrate dehydrogenase